MSEAREISRMAVLGAGVMGSEIAHVAASAGLEVLLLDSDPAALERGLAHISKIGARAVARGRATEEDVAATLARVTPTSDASDLGTADLAIEAVPEILEVKKSVIATLDSVLPPGAYIASNTSGLSIGALGRETSRPELVLGLHFFNPASVMKLVEVIRGEGTSEAAAAAGADLAARLGKIPVRVNECPGFLVNRILVRALSEAYLLADETGADRAAADAAAVADGPAPMGPFALGDLIGLDTLDHIQDDLKAAYGERFADGGQVAAQVAAGRLGRKSGAGFFDGSGPEGAEVDDAGRAVAERYYSSALDEARRCLAEDVAARDDVDVAMRYGCGWSEGPLAWGAARGLPTD